MPNTVDVLQQRFLKEIFTLILNGLNRAYNISICKIMQEHFVHREKMSFKKAHCDCEIALYPKYFKIKIIIRIIS